MAHSEEPLESVPMSCRELRRYERDLIRQQLVAAARGACEALAPHAEALMDDPERTLGALRSDPGLSATQLDDLLPRVLAELRWEELWQALVGGADDRSARAPHAARLSRALRADALHLTDHGARSVPLPLHDKERSCPDPSTTRLAAFTTTPAVPRRVARRRAA